MTAPKTADQALIDAMMAHAHRDPNGEGDVDWALVSLCSKAELDRDADAIASLRAVAAERGIRP